MQLVEAQVIEKAYRAKNNVLNNREKDVIQRYYGLKPHVRHSLREIGDMYDVTRERIRQIKVDALKKLGVK